MPAPLQLLPLDILPARATVRHRLAQGRVAPKSRGPRQDPQTRRMRLQRTPHPSIVQLLSTVRVSTPHNSHSEVHQNPKHTSNMRRQRNAKVSQLPLLQNHTPPPQAGARNTLSFILMARAVKTEQMRPKQALACISAAAILAIYRSHWAMVLKQTREQSLWYDFLNNYILFYGIRTSLDRMAMT